MLMLLIVYFVWCCVDIHVVAVCVAAVRFIACYGIVCVHGVVVAGDVIDVIVVVAVVDITDCVVYHHLYYLLLCARCLRFLCCGCNMRCCYHWFCFAAVCVAVFVGVLYVVISCYYFGVTVVVCCVCCPFCVHFLFFFFVAFVVVVLPLTLLLFVPLLSSTFSLHMLTPLIVISFVLLFNLYYVDVVCIYAVFLLYCLCFRCVCYCCRLCW